MYIIDNLDLVIDLQIALLIIVQILMTPGAQVKIVPILEHIANHDHLTKILGACLAFLPLHFAFEDREGVTINLGNIGAELAALHKQTGLFEYYDVVAALQVPVEIGATEYHSQV